ncbi:MAG: hypothetical protein F6K61_04275 [Sphaerospermopsis sp. SIO1G1]|nr:hypothetical protein [Sphaerospermopsis sp. SIO1G1]
MGLFEQLIQWLTQSINSHANQTIYNNKNQVIKSPSTELKTQIENTQIENEQIIKDQQSESIDDPILEDSISQHNEQIENIETPINQTTSQSVSKTLQYQIQDLPENGKISVWPPGEYPGPIIINHPLVLDGKGATIWAIQGPVLSIFSDDVILRNLKIEVTGEMEIGNSEHNCSILVDSAKNLTFENIEVRGSVMGISEENGEWEYPLVLNIGSIAHGKEYDFRLRIIVPIGCEIVSEISGIEFNPLKLNPGANEIYVHIEKLPEDTLINGNIYLFSANLKRRIGVTAHIVDAANPSISEIDSDILWEAESWLISTSRIVEDIPELNIVSVDIPELEIEPKITTEVEFKPEPKAIINIPPETSETIAKNVVKEIQTDNQTVSIPKTYRKVEPNAIFSVKIKNNTQPIENNNNIEIESVDTSTKSKPINPIFEKINNRESSTTEETPKTKSAENNKSVINPLFNQSSTLNQQINSDPVSQEDSSLQNDSQPKKRTQTKPNNIFFQDD